MQGAGASRDRDGGAFGQVCGVREGTAWMGKLRIWVGQGRGRKLPVVETGREKVSGGFR